MRRFFFVVEIISALSLGLVTLVVAADAFLRYTSQIQLFDAYAIASYLQAVAVFWGIAVITYMSRHISVDLLWNFVGARTAVAVDFAAYLASGIFLGLLSWMLCIKVARLYASGEMTSELQLPIWPIVLAGSLGIICAFLLCMARLWLTAKSLLKRG